MFFCVLFFVDFVFFFQAEDGIRDRDVTGVQTCALPISWADDRPSTPRRQPRLTSKADHDRVCEARRRTGWGPRLIASELGMPHSTVSRCLRRRGLSRPPTAARGEVHRHEWPCPGELLQI